MGPTAVYAWTQDLDGNLADNSDQEVFYAAWDGTAWSAATRLTNDTIADQNLRAAVAPSGDVSLVWQRGSDLVLDRNFAGSPTIARPGSQTVAFADYALTLGPGGNLVLIWQEQSPDGVGAHYEVYDPDTGGWSQDESLFADSSLERSFAPTWDSSGNLTIAYDRVQLQNVSKTVTTQDGQTITIDNVPQPGRVDLGVVKRTLAKDVGFLPGDFTVEGSDQPGETLALTAKVRNLGDLPVENLQVAFYDGDPSAGGSEILPRQTISGLFNGAATQTVAITWTVPEPAAPHTLFAVIDPDDLIGETDETNNALSVNIGGTDLAIFLSSQTVQSDGSARVIVDVTNQGAPTAAASTLAIRYADDQAGTPLATASIPALNPGALAEVALDLPPGGVSAERLFTVTADDAGVVADVDRGNNSEAFSMSLPISACVGDCSSSGEVTVDELLTMVNIALGNAEVASCEAGDANLDGQITIDEILAAVNNALTGCG